MRLWTFVYCFMALFAPLSNIAQAQIGDVEHGKYLVTIGICESCHTARGSKGEAIKELRLAGGRQSGGLNTPNLTPDLETGLGSWSVADIVTAFRSGHRPDHTIIRPPMGVFFYSGFSDYDAFSIAVYLKSLAPVRNKVERTPVKAPLPVWPEITSVPEPDRADRIALGHYLTQTVSHCFQCHSPKGQNGLPDLTRAGLGGNTYQAPGGGSVVSANLTPGNPDGIVGWTDEQVKKAITQGVRPDQSKMVNVMDFDLYDQMKPDDLSALVAFLRTLKPLKADESAK